QLAFAERQTIAQCLISKVIVTGEAVDIQFVLPFACTPQVSPRLTKEPEGTPGHFYRLRLAHFYLPAAPIPLHHRTRTGEIHHREAREQQPFNRLLSRGRCDLLHIDGRYFDRWERSSWPPCLLKHDLLGRHGDRELPRWPLGGASQGKREAAQRLRLTHCCPQV